MMAPHDKAGLIGKAKPRTLSVADNPEPKKIAPLLANVKQAGARLIIFTCEHRNQVAGSRPDQMNRGRHVYHPRERVSSALGARPPISEAINEKPHDGPKA
jgi:hypothetical protein